MIKKEDKFIKMQSKNGYKEAKLEYVIKYY